MFDTLGFILTMANSLMFIYFVCICIISICEYPSKLIVWFLPLIFVIISTAVGVFSIWVYKMVNLSGVLT